MTDDASDGTPPKGACLHCHAEHNKIQVHCDSCGGFICSECHWCHEANHEIRVCDRCDSFFCKDCDEMDQCDDCGEVVCSGCCSLLSCKFCGGGLCEECAVACGRCGIVLCARDAKFAVECDTCKLSYCLVCLASGQKEACIRCGHRPSKRMEQLVHLRLKSIYKAFQQSARTSDKHTHLKRAALAAQKKAIGPKIDPVIQQAQADAAAASLLKELEEEEAEAKKQSSKKKKKRKKKKCGDDGDEEERINEITSTFHAKNYTDERFEASIEKCQPLPPSPLTHEADTSRKELPILGTDQPHKNPIIDKSTKRSSRHRQGSVKKHSDDTNDSLETFVTSMARASTPPPAEDTLALPEGLEEKLLALVTSRDSAGIESLLEEWKGVPGRSGLRKNAKKALKKLREEEAELNRDPLLKVVSTTIKSKTCEVVFSISPVVVGLVIGKGGVRIRELMEESGAKVWIDQESMQVHQPRIVYVSGPKKSVDIATNMIQRMVKEAPQDDGNHRKDNEIIAHPQIVTDERPAQDEGDRDDWAEHKMPCEARFVPLLIGKRGWTIKHIQDSSGAKVDIDQNLTPRVITITGPSESVQTAIRLVLDVLSYPEGQLQRKDDEEEILGYERSMGAHSPPPSSLIMMSTISASSSLSSTPEPSMASSKNGKFAHDFSQIQHQYMPQPPGVFESRVETYPGESLHGLLPRQQPNFQHTAYPSRQHHLQQEFAPLQPGCHHPQIERTGVSRMIPPGLGHSLSSDGYGMHPPNLQGISSPPQRSPMPHIPVQNHHQQQSILYLQRHRSALDQLGDSYQQSQQPQRHFPDMWEGRNNAAPPYGVSDLFPQQQPFRQQQLPPGLSGPMYPPNIRASLASTNDDSNLVDALFGPSGTDSNLLHDLHGLNIRGWTGSGISWNEQKTGRSQLVPEQQLPSESRFHWG